MRKTRPFWWPFYRGCGRCPFDAVKDYCVPIGSCVRDDNATLLPFSHTFSFFPFFFCICTFPYHFVPTQKRARNIPAEGQKGFLLSSLGASTMFDSGEGSVFLFFLTEGASQAHAAKAGTQKHARAIRHMPQKEQKNENMPFALFPRLSQSVNSKKSLHDPTLR